MERKPIDLAGLMQAKKMFDVEEHPKEIWMNREMLKLVNKLSEKRVIDRNPISEPMSIDGFKIMIDNSLPDYFIETDIQRKERKSRSKELVIPSGFGFFRHEI